MRALSVATCLGYLARLLMLLCVKPRGVPFESDALGLEAEDVTVVSDALALQREIDGLAVHININAHLSIAKVGPSSGPCASVKMPEDPGSQWLDPPPALYCVQPDTRAIWGSCQANATSTSHPLQQGINDRFGRCRIHVHQPAIVFRLAHGESALWLGWLYFRVMGQYQGPILFIGVDAALGPGPGPNLYLTAITLLGFESARNYGARLQAPNATLFADGCDIQNMNNAEDGSSLMVSATAVALWGCVIHNIETSSAAEPQSSRILLIAGALLAKRTNVNSITAFPTTQFYDDDFDGKGKGLDDDLVDVLNVSAAPPGVFPETDDPWFVDAISVVTQFGAKLAGVPTAAPALNADLDDGYPDVPAPVWDGVDYDDGDGQPEAAEPSHDDYGDPSPWPAPSASAQDGYDYADAPVPGNNRYWEDYGDDYSSFGDQSSPAALIGMIALGMLLTVLAFLAWKALRRSKLRLRFGRLRNRHKQDDEQKGSTPQACTPSSTALVALKQESPRPAPPEAFDSDGAGQNYLLTQRVTVDHGAGGDLTTFHTSQVFTRTSAAGSTPGPGGMCNVDVPFLTRPEFESLHDALDGMELKQMALYGRFRRLSAVERRTGGQGLVQFVLDMENARSCAVKFFLHRAAFEHECMILTDPALQEAVTDSTVEIFDNKDGAHKGPDGYVLPPSIVMERGQSLNEWLRSARPHLATIVDAMLGIVRRLQALHEAGYVHRDIKPGNLIRLVSQREHGWALIDFGSAAKDGQIVPLSFSLKYAAPETLISFEAGQKMVKALPAVDIWAVGVICLELVTHSPVFPPLTSGETVRACIVGREPLPWEHPEKSAQILGSLKGMRRTVMQCLSRDALSRPTAAQLVHSWEHFFDGDTTLAAKSDYTVPSCIGSATSP